MALETSFHIFGYPGDSLEIPWIFMSILGHTEILSTREVGGKLAGSQDLVTTIPGFLKPTLEISRQRLGVLRLRREYIGYMIH